MSEARAWLRCATVGVAALLGQAPGLALIATIPAGDLLDRLFGHLDRARKGRARELSERAAELLASLAREHERDPGRLASARLTTETLLARFGLTDTQLAGLALDPDAAAAHVLASATFAATERAEVEPLCRAILRGFYANLPQAPDLLAELLPHIHREGLRRLGRIESKLDDQGGTLAAILAAVHAARGVPLPVLREILARLGEQDVPPEPGAIEARLRAKADEYEALTARLRRLTNDDPDVQVLRREAADLLARADFAAADARLAAAEARDLETVEELETLAARRRLSAAATRAERAGAARLGCDPEQPRQRPRDARQARGRDGAAGGGGRRVQRPVVARRLAFPTVRHFAPRSRTNG